MTRKKYSQAFRMGDALEIESFESGSKTLHRIPDAPDNVWNRYIMDLWRDMDNDILKTVFCNLGLNANIVGFPKEQDLAKKHGCNIPAAILIDSTSACKPRRIKLSSAA